MLGLTFRDDLADFEAALDAFIAALGSMTGDDSSTRERRARRRSPRRRRPDHEHRRDRLYEGRSRKVGAQRGRMQSEGAAASAGKRLDSYIASLATALGFEAGDDTTSSGVDA